MKRNLINSIIMAGLLAAAVSCQQSPSSDGALNPVTCKAGTFAGKVENGVTKFFGIRFAEDPLDHMFEPRALCLSRRHTSGYGVCQCLPKPERVRLMWLHERSFFLDQGLGGDITQHGK